VPGGADDVDNLRKIVQAAIAGGLPGAPHWLQDVPAVGPTLSGLWNSWAEDLSVMGEFFKPYFGQAAEFGLSLLLGLANGVLMFLLALFVAFFFFASGDRLAAKLHEILGRIAGARAPRLIEVTGATVRGVVYGILGTAVVQGILTTFGLWLSGVPRALLLGVIAGGLSVLPIGAPTVWIPAGLWLLAQGKTAWGIFLLVYGVVAVSGADSLIRPFFIARGAQLPFLLTMLGVLGGALAFGLLGIFVGPVLLGVGFTLVNEWSGSDEAAPLALKD
jgi:predicted PurR-regulated permease PerM